MKGYVWKFEHHQLEAYYLSNRILCDYVSQNEKDKLCLMNIPNYYIYFHRCGWVNTDISRIAFEYLHFSFK